jgi:putative FmdB family regulatory protein
MPVYEYFCEECGMVEEVLRSISQSSNGLGCFNCANPNMRRIFHAPAVMNRQKPGSFKWSPEKMNSWDDRVAHLKEVENKDGTAGLRKVRKEVGEVLYNKTLSHKKENYG